MWDLLGPGLEPVSPALAGGSLTTVPLGKSLGAFFLSVVSLSHNPTRVSWDLVPNELLALESLSEDLLLGNIKVDLGGNLQYLVSPRSV